MLRAGRPWPGRRHISEVLAGRHPGIAEKIFEKHGIAKTDLTWMQIGGNGARAAALLAGNADRVVCYGSAYLKLRAEGFPAVDTMQAEFPGLHDDMWASTRDWLDKNSDLAVAIAKAQIEAAKWFHEDRAGWMALAKEKVEGLDEAIASQLYDKPEKGTVTMGGKPIENALGDIGFVFQDVGLLAWRTVISNVLPPSNESSSSPRGWPVSTWPWPTGPTAWPWPKAWGAG